jgi:copper chaperone CopZ
MIMDDQCHVEPLKKTATLEEIQSTAIIMLAVQGMGCTNCAARVQNSLLQINGVIAAIVDHGYGLAQVVYNPDMTDQEALIYAVARAGGDGRHEYRACMYD